MLVIFFKKSLYLLERIKKYENRDIMQRITNLEYCQKNFFEFSVEDTFSAIENNDLQSVKLLLNDETINHQNERGETPLMLAVYCQHQRIVEELLKRKAVLCTVDKEGCNVLHHAIIGNVYHRDILRALLNKIDTSHITEIYEAHSDMNSTPFEEFVYCFLFSKFYKNSDKSRWTEFFEKHWDECFVEFGISQADTRDTSIAKICEKSYSILDFPLNKIEREIEEIKFKRIIEAFLEHVKELNRKIKLIEEKLDYKSVLAQDQLMDFPRIDSVQEAAKIGDLRSLQYLLVREKGIDCVDEFGMTPLMTAALYNENDSVTFLLERGANPFYTHRKSRRNNALHFAVKIPKPTDFDRNNMEKGCDRKIIRALLKNLSQKNEQIFTHENFDKAIPLLQLILSFIEENLIFYNNAKNNTEVENFFFSFQDLKYCIREFIIGGQSVKNILESGRIRTILNSCTEKFGDRYSTPVHCLLRESDKFIRQIQNSHRIDDSPLLNQLLQKIRDGGNVPDQIKKNLSYLPLPLQDRFFIGMEKFCTPLTDNFNRIFFTKNLSAKEISYLEALSVEHSAHSSEDMPVVLDNKM